MTLCIRRDALIAAPGDVQSIILINAGGNVDLLEEFQALDEQPLAHLTFYVIDSHRSMHLANVFDDGRVYVSKHVCMCLCLCLCMCMCVCVSKLYERRLP